MYIEFRLSSDFVRNKLSAWAAKYNIKYRTKVFKYTLRVTFDSNREASWISESKISQPFMFRFTLHSTISTPVISKPLFLFFYWFKMDQYLIS